MEVAGLRKARSYTKAKLTRLTTQVFGDSGEVSINLDRTQAEARLERLEEIYREFEDIQRQLLEKLGGDFTVDDTTEEERFEEKYLKVKTTLRRFIGQTPENVAISPTSEAIMQLLQQQTELIKHLGRERDSQDSVMATASVLDGNETLAAILSRQTEILDRVAITAGSVNTDTRVKLPTIKLPQFDGKIEEWKCFSDSFRSIIHDKPNLSNIEKFQYLISSISGDAAKIIESIELTGQNYATAWELLQQRYDDPRSLKKKHIQCLFAMPHVIRESAKAIRDLIDYTSRHLRMLKVLGLPTDTWDELIMHLMETRFDVKTLRAWEEEVERNGSGNLDDMMEFLRKRCQTLERIESRSIEKNEKIGKNVDYRGKNSVTSLKSHSEDKRSCNQKVSSLTTSVNAGKCYFCNGAHFIYSCQKFLDLPVSERIKEVRRFKLCINCLRNDHYAKTCKLGSCRECNGRHNTLCHLPQDNKASVTSKATQSAAQTSGELKSTVQASSELSSNVAVHASSWTEGRGVLMATAIVKATRSNGCSVPIRVLLDSASEANFITQSTCNKLGLKRSRVSEMVTGLNEIESMVHSMCEVHVKSQCSSFQINVQCLIVPKITKDLPAREIDYNKLQVPDNIILADPEFYKVGPIDLLIGAEFFFELLGTGKIELDKDRLILQNTKFGWIIAGSIPSAICVGHQPNSINSFICRLDSNENLNESLERFWMLENYDNNIPQTLSAEEEKCEQHFVRTTTRADDGRFIVRLPFRDNDLPIGNNKEIALKKLYQLERSFRRNETIRNLYSDFMREYIDLKHMSIVTDFSDDSKPIVYLPHHGVLKESSTSTKLRVVFDASAKNNEGISLNDALLIGPVLQDNLINIMLRFRFYKIALTADLRMMYRQVLVHSDDRNFQHILWRFSTDDSVKEYCLNTITYGQASASYLAIRCLRQLAIENAERYPLASSALLNDTYVDDIISGANTIEDACALQKQLSDSLQKGGFEAHKWCSNLETTLVDVPINLRESSSPLDITANEVINTLGLAWNPILDEFQFKAQTMSGISTKRKMLSEISKLFDPLGLIGPVLTVAKCLMQRLWKIKVGWDDPLPEAILHEWKNFQDSIKRVPEIRVPRTVIKFSSDNRFYVQGFCDASENAYGACVYLQSISDIRSENITKLLCSKSRVAPLKGLSVPRLELCSALLLAKLINNVKKAIRIKIDGIRAWSDSMVVLYWIRGDISRWKPFVANRIREIINIIPASHWNHVKGSSNPADLISRGVTSIQLRDSCLWWNGPEWLSDSCQCESSQDTDDTNVTQNDLREIEEETKKIERLCYLSTKVPPLMNEIGGMVERCSALTKIERSLAYCLRFIHNCRNKDGERISSRLTVQELGIARCKIIKYSQHSYFQEDLKNLQNNRELNHTSKLRQLYPFLDNDGIIRVGGRLQEAAWTFERRHPILLPAQCKITRLLIEKEHRTLLHAGPQLLLASIRQKYWPLNARNLVRRVCYSCIWCFKANPRGLTQVMGSLPGDRIRPSRAFAITGVDFAGPIVTLVNKGRGRKTCKSYIALFVCFSTRAVHLEAVSELSTAAFLAALHRFIGRRGLPRKICSDNATNFVGASRELEELYKFVRTSIHGNVGDALLERGIEWSFIPPYSPHMGGIWEAGVKSCKYHLKRVMGISLFTFEELSTALVQIEACLNSRPLSPLSSDPSDLQPLTPGHFLVGGPLTSLPEQDLSDVNIHRLDRWELIQRAVQDFWKRWAAEYVATLQVRTKWKERQDNLKVNDLVLLKEDNLLPLKWKTGRVTDVHAGKDGLVRVVTVRTATGICKRAISKLCRLPLDELSKTED